MKPVRWGILSPAKIGLERVLPGMRKSAWCELHAIASRDAARARTAADALGIAKAYGSYEALLADPEVEAVYNPLPNHLHVPMTLAAVAAGKHVLCEKPIALTAAEAEQLRATKGKALVMEAFMVRFHDMHLACDLAQFGGLIGIDRDRLFAQHMLAGARRGQRHRHMQMIGQRVVDGLDLGIGK